VTADDRRYDDAGATAVEYGLIVFAIAAVITIAVFLFGTQVKELFNNSCATINSAGQTTTATGNCS